MLAAMGNESAARREIRQAQAGGLPDDVAITVDQFARALRSTRQWGGSIEVALAPDTNVNRATQARTLDTVIAPLTLSEDARARSGVGLKLAGQALRARIELGDSWALLPRIASAGTLYRAKEFNDISGSALLGVEWRRGRDRLSPSVGRTWRWYGGMPYARTATISMDWLRSDWPARTVAGTRRRVTGRLSAQRFARWRDLRSVCGYRTRSYGTLGRWPDDYRISANRARSRLCQCVVWSENRGVAGIGPGHAGRLVGGAPARGGRALVSVRRSSSRMAAALLWCGNVSAGHGGRVRAGRPPDTRAKSIYRRPV